MAEPRLESPDNLGVLEVVFNHLQMDMLPHLHERYEGLDLQRRRTGRRIDGLRVQLASLPSSAPHAETLALAGQINQLTDVKNALIDSVNAARDSRGALARAVGRISMANKHLNSLLQPRTRDFA
jgi:hypothetical protein